MRINISVERSSDDPSFCKGYIECTNSDGKTFTMATGKFKSNVGALKELRDILKRPIKDIEFNLKQIKEKEKII